MWRINPPRMYLLTCIIRNKLKKIPQFVFGLFLMPENVFNIWRINPPDGCGFAFPMLFLGGSYSTYKNIENNPPFISISDTP